MYGCPSQDEDKAPFSHAQKLLRESPQCHAGGLLLLGRTQVSVGPSRGSVAGSTALVLPRQADGRKSFAAAPAQRLPLQGVLSIYYYYFIYFLVGLCFLFIF